MRDRLLDRGRRTALAWWGGPNRSASVVRLIIWIVTVGFVGMMFHPLVTQMIARLSGPVDPDFPY